MCIMGTKLVDFVGYQLQKLIKYKIIRMHFH